MRPIRLVAALVISLGAVTLATPVLPAQAATSRTVELRADAAFPQVGAQTTVIGSVSSTPTGSAVKIQQLKGGGAWATIQDVTTAADGSYRGSFTFDTAGTVSYRAIAPATGTADEAVSPTKIWKVTAAPATAFDAAPNPTISGSLTVGSILTTQMGNWSPNPGTFSFRWVRDGVPFNRWVQRYQVTADDIGKRLTVAVSATRSGAVTVRESASTTAIARGTFTTTPVVITGDLHVGGTVQTTVATWMPVPESVRYQWRRNGSPIPGATSASYTLTAQDGGTSLSVDAEGSANGVDTATRSSDPALVPGSPPAAAVTFGDLMHPAATTLASTIHATYEARGAAPTWTNDKLTRWDAAGAFTQSLTPHATSTLSNANTPTTTPNPATGAEYVTGNSTFKNADVSFDFTGTRLAIEYRTYTAADAQVWIDGHPVSNSPIAAINAGGGASRNWIVVTLPQRETVHVRFAGPLIFTGVHTPAADNAVVAAGPKPFTLGIVSDSFYEVCYAGSCFSRSAAPTLSTLTGFRIWNMAQSATGYINDGSGTYEAQTGDGKGYTGFHSSPYGSSSRMALLHDAPIDAVLVNGTLNDHPVWTPAQQRDAVDATLTKIEAQRPDLPIILVGIEPLYYSRAYPSRIAHYGALTANLAGMVGRHPHVVGFIDPFSNHWLTGSGSTLNPRNDGNQDKYIGKDGIHPNGDGQEYYQGRIVAEMRSMPYPSLPAG